MFDEFPHVRIQMYAATHGIDGAHIACPHASLAVPVDPTQRISDAVAVRCAELLVQSL